jgi:hypothetical protein
MPYYDRMFMRTLMAARVEWRYKPDASKPGIKNNKEYGQLMSLAHGGAYNKQV